MLLCFLNIVPYLKITYTQTHTHKFSIFNSRRFVYWPIHTCAR